MSGRVTGVGKNVSGNLYGLTAFCPIKPGTVPGADQSRTSAISDVLAGLPRHRQSLFARTKSTYFARFYLLRDVFKEGKPAREEHLKSHYLVFCTSFHGTLPLFLDDLWSAAEEEVRAIWKHCIAFDSVDDASAFADYMGRCQVSNSLLFNGSTDDSLAEQLKSLYLKQAFSRFVVVSQELEPAALKAAFVEFLGTVRLERLDRPTWHAGATSLDDVEIS